MVGFIRGAFVMAMGWLLMKAVNRVVLTMQKQAEQIRNRDAQGDRREDATQRARSDHMLDMKACPQCGVYTTGRCDNPSCPQ